MTARRSRPSDPAATALPSAAAETAPARGPGRPGGGARTRTAAKTGAGGPPRGPGRGAGAEDQRERLLDAAVALLAERGVAATQVKAIAQRAGVTPALVHYYFGDRGRLLDAVAEERLGPLVDRVFAPQEHGDADPAALLAGIAERLIRAAVATPWFPALWMREIVTGEGELRERVVQRFGLPRLGDVVTALSAARRRGQIDDALAPPLLMVSVIGLALLPLATAHLWRRLPGADAVDVDAMIVHVRALLIHGIHRAHPEPDTDPDADRSKDGLTGRRAGRH